MGPDRFGGKDVFCYVYALKYQIDRLPRKSSPLSLCTERTRRISQAFPWLGGGGDSYIHWDYAFKGEYKSIIAQSLQVDWVR